MARPRKPDSAKSKRDHPRTLSGRIEARAEQEKIDEWQAEAKRRGIPFGLYLRLALDAFTARSRRE